MISIIDLRTAANMSRKRDSADCGAKRRHVRNMAATAKRLSHAWSYNRYCQSHGSLLGESHFNKRRINMLKGIPKILPPELLKILCEMGHTDELTIGDGNFPGTTYGKKVIRMDGHGVPEILDAILQVFPLDTYVEHPVTLMAVVKGDTVETPIWDTYKEIVRKYDDRGDACFEEIDKWEFYDKTKEHSSVVIQTGESALYANIILKKGVVVD